MCQYGTTNERQIRQLWSLPIGFYPQSTKFKASTNLLMFTVFPATKHTSLFRGWINLIVSHVLIKLVLHDLYL